MGYPLNQASGTGCAGAWVRGKPKFYLFQLWCDFGQVTQFLSKLKCVAVNSTYPEGKRVVRFD